MNHKDTSHDETPNAEAESLAENPTSLPATSGPLKTFTVGETRYTLLGTAHVSAESADDVRALLDSGAFDAVAIELCDARHHSMSNPDAMGEQDLFQVFREGKAGMVEPGTGCLSATDCRSVRHPAGGRNACGS